MCRLLRGEYHDPRLRRGGGLARTRSPRMRPARDASGVALAYSTRNVAVEMLWLEMCGEERDLVASGNGVYGGGGPREVAAVVVVVTAELRGRTMGGEEGVKIKRRLGKDAAAVEDARLRVWVWMLWSDDDDAQLKTVLLCG